MHDVYKYFKPSTETSPISHVTVTVVVGYNPY